MSLARHNPRRDKSEAAIVKALEAQGCTIARLSGAGVPDLLVARGGALVALCEVKSRLGKFTPAQVKFRERWRGPVPVVLRTVDDAIALVQWARDAK